MYIRFRFEVRTDIDRIDPGLGSGKPVLFAAPAPCFSRSGFWGFLKQADSCFSKKKLVENWKKNLKIKNKNIINLKKNTHN